MCRNKWQRTRHEKDTDWKLETWNCISLRFVGYKYALLNELKLRNFDVGVRQEIGPNSLHSVTNENGFPWFGAPERYQQSHLDIT